MEPLKDEVTYLPCSECGKPVSVNVVYLPYLDGGIRCADKECQWKKKRK